MPIEMPSWLAKIPWRAALGEQPRDASALQGPFFSHNGQAGSWQTCRSRSRRLIQGWCVTQSWPHRTASAFPVIIIGDPLEGHANLTQKTSMASAYDMQVRDQRSCSDTRSPARPTRAQRLGARAGSSRFGAPSQLGHVLYVQYSRRYGSFYCRDFMGPVNKLTLSSFVPMSESRVESRSA